MDFPTPITIVDRYQAELEWRFNCFLDLIWEIIEELEDIKNVLEYDDSPRPPSTVFDPL